MAGLLATGSACAEALNRTASASEARSMAMRHASELQVAASDELETKDVVIDADGTRHERVARTYQGLPVIGGDMVIHSRQGQLLGASRSLVSTQRPDVTPKISLLQAEAGARDHFAGRIDSVQSVGLVVFAHDAEPRLAYELRVRGESRETGRANMRYFVDAIHGHVLARWNLFQTAAATGQARTLLAGTVPVTTTSTEQGFELVDPSRGDNAVHDAGGQTDSELNLTQARRASSRDNIWGDGTLTDPNTVAGDVAFGVAATWDYYKDVHGRNGVWDDGRGTKSYVHVLINAGGGQYTAANAAWNGESMEYGDGGDGFLPLVSVDITGHEMTHGVIQATAGLAYVSESGGLNEATADIFGTMVERRALGGSGRANYLMGEQVDTTGVDLIRYMFKPSLDGHSPDCWSGELKDYEVHSSSGVGNHFFYLLAEGVSVPIGFGSGSRANLAPADLVCNGDTGIEGIGADAAQRIWYRALVVYMTTSTNYAQAREATVRAAADLHGASSNEVAVVKRAWDAVGVH